LEVTRDAYDAFLAKPPSLPMAVPCNWKTSFTPGCTTGPDASVDAGPQDGALPVVCVDWCDALAFCNSQGRTLCHGSYDNVAIVEDSDWYAVCSNLGESAYPYGASYHDEICNGLDHSGDGVLAAAGQAACVTDSDVLNMSGNVWEWVDECDDASGANDACNLRGGSFRYDAQALACRSKVAPDRNARSDEYGFRCCAYE
jgi:formylglycine-generating enzyme required for sulfatase activity